MPSKFRKKPVTIEAMQWDRTEQTADALSEWTSRVLTTNEDGSTRSVAEQFMLLIPGWDDMAVDLLGEDEVADRLADGYDAVIYDDLHSTWVNVENDDWIIKGVQGEFYPCKPDIFAATYEAVSNV